MTYGEIYRSVGERESAFADYCNSHKRCAECPIFAKVQTPSKCEATWLKMTAPESEVAK